MRPIVPEDIPRRAVAQREAAMGVLTRAAMSVARATLNPNTKAATTPAMTSVQGWAAELSPVTTAFLANLTPYSAGAALLARGLSLSFDGAGQINVPAVTTPLADFVGQGQSIPVVQAAAAVQASLKPHKLAVITVLSRETVENTNAENLVRTALLESTGPALDRRLFDANPGVPDLRPPGLLHSIAPLTAAPAGDKILAMGNDLGALANAVAPFAGNGEITFIAAAAQSVAIGLQLVKELPWPLLTSTTLVSGTVIAIANAALVSAADAGPAIDTTKAATLHMDSVPGAIATSGTMVSPVTATFQNDLLGLRMRWPLSWALRNPAALAWVQGTNW